MIQNTPQPQEMSGDAGAKWFRSPVGFHNGNLVEIGAHIPTFERRSFGLTQAGKNLSRLNENLDMIVRMPFADDDSFIPVGVVSKDYALVPHTDVLRVVIKALDTVKISPAGVRAELMLTEYGERMALSIYLPDKYNFDPGDGHPMALRLECMNSVDGSTRFRALMGWFRFVCSNGLIIGVTQSDIRRRHVGGEIRLEDVAAVIKSGLAASDIEKKNFKDWRQVKVTMDQLVPWVNKDLKEGWGFKAATRAFHIAQFGHDADVIGQYKGSIPTNIVVKKTKRVPGSPDKCHNLFDLSQILAWLAKERRDVQEQLKWREQIPGLMAPLMN